MKIVIVTHRGQITEVYADTPDALSIETVDDSWHVGDSLEIKPLSDLSDELREDLARRRFPREEQEVFAHDKRLHEGFFEGGE